MAAAVISLAQGNKHAKQTKSKQTTAQVTKKCTRSATVFFASVILKTLRDHTLRACGSLLFPMLSHKM